MLSKKRKFLACTLNDLKLSDSYGLELVIDGITNQYFLIYHANKVFSYANRCPHTGVNLDWVPHQFLDVNNQFIQCATHGALFNIENGHCFRGPCVGDQLQTIESVVEKENIYLIL
jgi:nitrite reductase/ring-hydroxylating ferredoxin subunit